MTSDQQIIPRAGIIVHLTNRLPEEQSAVLDNVLYLTWADVVERPESTFVRVERALREAGWDPVEYPRQSRWA